MSNKPASRNWNDIQVAIATIAMALTLVFWNLFAGPDRASALKRAQEQSTLPPPQPVQTLEPVLVQPTPVQQLANGKILLGGTAPQTQIIVQARNGNGSGGGGGGGGGGGTGTS